MGSGRRVLSETFLLLLLFLVMSKNGVSSSLFCGVDSSFQLKDNEVLLVPVDEYIVNFHVVVARCGVDTHFQWNLEDFKYSVSNPARFVTNGQDQRWFQVQFNMMYRSPFSTLSVSIKADQPYVQERRFAQRCEEPVYNITSDPVLALAMWCHGKGPKRNHPKENTRSDNYLDKWLKLEKDDPVYRSSFRGGHIIFIPVGAIIFLLSVCLRCCLCRRKKMIQRVRTITVVRRVPVTPPDSVQIAEPGSPESMDLPPSYIDIENELPPPSYSELETVNEVSGGGRDAPPPAGGTRQEALETNNSPSSTDDDPSSQLSRTTDPSTGLDANTAVEGDLSETETRSTMLSRVLSLRSLKSQFSFKPMKEEEE